MCNVHSHNITHSHLAPLFYVVESIVTITQLHIDLKKSMPKMHLSARRQILINNIHSHVRKLKQKNICFSHMLKFQHQ